MIKHYASATLWEYVLWTAVYMIRQSLMRQYARNLCRVITCWTVTKYKSNINSFTVGHCERIPYRSQCYHIELFSSYWQWYFLLQISSTEMVSVLPKVKECVSCNLLQVSKDRHVQYSLSIFSVTVNYNSLTQLFHVFFSILINTAHFCRTHEEYSASKRVFSKAQRTAQEWKHYMFAIK